jgi:hypothetical protein
VQDAFEGGVRYFEQTVRRVDPGWANVFGYLHRRFGLELESAEGQPLHSVPLVQARPGLAAVYRRLVDPAAAVDPARIAALPSVLDRITASALHCDRIPLPDDWVEVLWAATREGGYALTHAALSGEWTLENGCRPRSELDALQREQVEALVALVDDRAALADEFRTPTDLWLEAMAMLSYLGAGDRFRDAWIDHVVAAQRLDGGWPERPGAKRSDPHTTALALWVLLERLRPDARPVRWVPPSGAGPGGSAPEGDG